MNMTLTRRDILHGSAGFGLAAALPGVSFAQSASDNIFILVILRGGLDGLVSAVPHGDPNYAGLRGNNAFNAADLTDLDGFYGLPPALSDWQSLWTANELLVVHALGIPYSTRSHFAAQEVLEIGLNRPTGTSGGWLARAMTLTGGRNNALAVAPGIPLVLRGDKAPMTWHPSRLNPPDNAGNFLWDLHAHYEADDILGPSYRQGMALRRIVSGDNSGSGDPHAPNMGIQFASARNASDVFSDLGRIINMETGPNTAVMELGGWDSHAKQGVLTGDLAINMDNLASGVLALKKSLGSNWDRTIVALVTEFGRTARFNGSGGTDHGSGTAAFLAGGNVNGGRVIADWPGLANNNLLDGRDLAITTDIRTLFKGLAQDHLKISTQSLNADVFPDSSDLVPMADLVRA